MGNTISFIQDLNSWRRVHFLRQESSHLEQHSYIYPFWPGVVEPDRILSMGQIELNCVLKLSWIVWNRTVLTFKLRTYAKLNCLKWNCLYESKWIWHWITYNSWYTIKPNQTKPKTKKMVLDASLLITQHYKVGIKGKKSNLGKGVAQSPTSQCLRYWKVIFGSPSTTVGQLIYIICMVKSLKL